MGRKSKWDDIKDRLEDVVALGRRGLSEAQMAAALDIGYSTFNGYKNKYPEFLEAIKKGKAHADGNVQQALYRRALGYEAEEKTYQVRVDPETLKRSMVLVEKKVKHIPPDVSAMALWLNNRCPDDFQRDPKRQELEERKFEHQKKQDELRGF